MMHSASLASGLTFEPGAHDVLICVACRSGSQCKLHYWARMRIVITMMSSCTLHAAPRARNYAHTVTEDTVARASAHCPLWCFLAMATLSDADIIRTAVGAAAPPQLHSAKVSIRRFPVHTVIFAKQ